MFTCEVKVVAGFTCLLGDCYNVPLGFPLVRLQFCAKGGADGWVIKYAAI